LGRWIIQTKYIDIEKWIGGHTRKRKKDLGTYEMEQGRKTRITDAWIVNLKKKVNINSYNSICPSKKKERTNIKGRWLEKAINDFIKYMA